MVAAYVVVATLVLTALASGLDLADCEVSAVTESGYVCGRRRPDANGGEYASFRGIPYAKQPLGELRFQELQPPEPFDGVFDAREAGPICPQIDVIYGPLLKPRSMSEDCIRINVHVPLNALPDHRDLKDPLSELDDPLSGLEDPLSGLDNPASGLDDPLTGLDEPLSLNVPLPGLNDTLSGLEDTLFALEDSVIGLDGTTRRMNDPLPIIAWVHGGSFSYGSGDADFHGPEYLVTKGVILITFNYRVNIPGFLSLKSKSIPGNNGLRDCRTALQWIQRNAKYFGGDPGNVTIAGQSAGGTIAHLLSISPACKGLFNKVIALSGSAISNFYSYSPRYSAVMAKLFLVYMGISIFEDPEIIHKQLIATPIERLIDGNRFLLDQFGLVTFSPVIETPSEKFIAMLPQDFDLLLDKGRDRKLPALFGCTSNEAETYKQRLVDIKLEAKMRLMPHLTVPLNLLFSSKILTIPYLTRTMLKEYYNNSMITLDQFLNVITDSYYRYPVFRAIEKRLKGVSAPTFYYEFSYHGERSVVKEAFNIDFPGAGHVEDITYFFRVNAVQGPIANDEMKRDDPDSMMREWMTSLITNFVITGDPTPVRGRYGLPQWPEAGKPLRFENIERPMVYSTKTLSPYLKKKKKFFDKQYKVIFGDK